MGAIRTEGLTKDYGAGSGLFDLDLDVEAGEVFGYLGPNGAGKTTTIRLLMDMIRPTRGRAEVFGVDCQGRPAEVKRLVGYLPCEPPQFGALRGGEVVTYLGWLRGGVSRARVTALAERLDLDLGRRFREYSRGNKQKLGLVLAFMHEPKLLILDEPTSGLDPLNQQEFYRMVARRGSVARQCSSPPTCCPRSSTSASGWASSGAASWCRWPASTSCTTSDSTTWRQTSRTRCPSRRCGRPPAWTRCPSRIII